MSDWIQETLYDNGTLINKFGIRMHKSLLKKSLKLLRKENFIY